jgi:hypothetical protein
LSGSQLSSLASVLQKGRETIRKSILAADQPDRDRGALRIKSLL